MNIIEDIKHEYRYGGIAQKLIFWNVGLFVIPLILFSILGLFEIDTTSFWFYDPRVNDWLSLSSRPADLAWKPWSLVTYAFLHAGFLHLIFNMMVLYFSGRLFLTFFTGKQLFGVYALSAIFAALVFILSFNTLPLLSGGGIAKMVGASASIMAILIAVAVYAPYYEVRLMLFGTVKLWHIAVVLIVLDLIQVSVENQGGHLAHLSGALFGFVYVKLLKSGTDLSKAVSAVTGLPGKLFSPKKKTPFKVVHRNTAPKQRPMGKIKNFEQKQVDEILDKISKSGYDSLTKEEKEFLMRVGK